MSEDTSSPPANPTSTSGTSRSGDGGDSNSQRGSGNDRSGQRNRQRRGVAPSSGRFHGECEALKAYVYNDDSNRGNSEMFSHTSKAIGKHVARTIPGAGVFRNSLIKLELPVLEAPQPPDDQTDLVVMELWKINLKKYSDKEKDREKNAEQAFSIILGQCILFKGKML